MNDSQKWIEAAAGIEQDIEYLKHSLSKKDLTSLQVALSVYISNARTGVAWPKPDDLYCIAMSNSGSKSVIATHTLEDHKLAC